MTCDSFQYNLKIYILWVRFWRQEWKSDYEEGDVKKENIIE